MKNKVILISACLALCLAGCVTKNPDYIPPPPGEQATTPAYIADTAAISNKLAVLHGINDVSAPINPYALPLRGLLEGAGALAVVISGWIAKKKSDSAAAKTQALDTMAVGVIAAGPTAVEKVKEAAANSSNSDNAHISAAIHDNSA